MSLIVRADFEKFDVTYFKESIACFKLTNSCLEKYGLSYSKDKFA